MKATRITILDPRTIENSLASLTNTTVPRGRVTISENEGGNWLFDILVWEYDDKPEIKSWAAIETGSHEIWGFLAALRTAGYSPGWFASGYAGSDEYGTRVCWKFTVRFPVNYRVHTDVDVYPLSGNESTLWNALAGQIRLYYEYVPLTTIDKAVKAAIQAIRNDSRVVE
jgi:hypothetical protein